MKLFVGYSKAPEQPQSSARPMCHSHTMTNTGREPATIHIPAYRSSPRYALRHGRQLLWTMHPRFDLTGFWTQDHWVINRTLHDLNVPDCIWLWMAKGLILVYFQPIQGRWIIHPNVDLTGVWTWDLLDHGQLLLDIGKTCFPRQAKN